VILAILLRRRRQWCLLEQNMDQVTDLATIWPLDFLQDYVPGDFIMTQDPKARYYYF
jgi:hypothetical protein